MPSKQPNFRLFNLMGKVIGVAFAIIGCIVCIWSFCSNSDFTDKIIGGGLSALMSILGVLMVIAKPFPPPDK